MQKESLRKWEKIVIFLVIAVVLIIFAVKLTFFSAQQCFDTECFQKAMANCNQVEYINDDDEATWEYVILGENDKMCDIKVTLLQIKKGELNAEKLAGFDMVCSYQSGAVLYPEKDLEQCHGRLKEELQTIVIKKLHQRILENIDEIGKEMEEYKEIS